MISKRQVILGIAGAVLLFFLYPFRRALLNLFFRPKGGEGEALHFPNPFQEDGKTLVSIVHGEDVEAMVRRAVELLGGWEKIAIKGKKILVKPNVVDGAPPPVTTNPAVVKAVVKELLRHGARQVWVGDMSALRTHTTPPNMEQTGNRQAAEEAGAGVVFFEDHSWVRVPTPGGRYLKGVYVTEWLFRVDRIINLPVIKTHHNATYSIALKNFVGATHGRERPYLVNLLHWEEVVAELNLAYTPHLNVLDGTTIMVAGGPWKGRAEKTNLIIATGDRVAADLIGLGLIKSFGAWKEVVKKEIREQKQVRRALELGLGVPQPSLIKIRSESLGGDAERFSRLLQDIQSHLEIS